MSELELGERLRKAYVAAMAAAHQAGARARIHVGKAVYDELQTIARTQIGNDFLALPASTTLWGVPVILEDDFEGDEIRVRAETVIA